MRRRFGTVVLAVLTAFFLLTMWSSATAPATFAERLGLTVANAGGYNEIRAQYAGFFLAAAAVCAAALMGTLARRSAYVVGTVIFGGLIAGRLVSLALNGGVDGYSRMIIALYFIDAVGFALTFTALLLDRRASSS